MEEEKKQSIKVKMVKYKIISSIIVIIYLCVLSLVVVKYLNTNRYWEIDIKSKNMFTEEGHLSIVNATVKNKMYNVMSSEDNYFISYHLYTDNNELIIYDNPRTFIDGIEPGYERDVEIQIAVPQEPGKYKVEIDIVKEGEYWFKDRGEKTAILDITVN